MPPTARRRPQPGQGAPALRPIPFTAAAHEHMEPCFVDAAGVIGAAQNQRQPIEVPAYGFLRHILLEVTLSGGSLGAGVLSQDFPFNILQQVMLSDVNGAPIFGPLDGFALLQANIWGGYGYRQDPRLDAGYDGTINGKFWLRIPVEISRHNGYGALANQNAAQSYKLQYTLNSNAVFTTQPTTAPAVTVRSFIECWSQPNELDLAGRPQMREPVGHGTTQFWSGSSRATVAGQNNIGFPRVGNLIRDWVIIARNAAGARVDTVFPDPFILQWDARNLHSQVTQATWIKKMMESIQAPAARDVGVFVFPFNTLVLGHAGDEEPNLWLQTVQASRIELQGVTALAGSLQIITNDVAAVEVDPAERYVETSATGFHPALGQPVPVGV